MLLIENTTVRAVMYAFQPSTRAPQATTALLLVGKRGGGMVAEWIHFYSWSAKSFHGFFSGLNSHVSVHVHEGA